MSTSKFNSSHIIDYNIIIIGENFFSGINLNELPSGCETLFLRRFNYVYMSNFKPILTEDELTLKNILQRIQSNQTSFQSLTEKHSNELINFILYKLKFNQYPYYMRIEPKYCIYREFNNDIGSIPDFSIEIKKRVKVVIECKQRITVFDSNNYGEYQIVGEMLAAGITNYVKKLIDNDIETIYCIRVIDAKFTFYQVKFNKEELCKIHQGEKNNLIIIKRFPSNKSYE